jgi:tetraprenyl-beta-curcumene synthase
MALVGAARVALEALPSSAPISESMGRASERIALYQSFNHGDACGSYEPFERWAKKASGEHRELHPWETAAAAGSTLTVLALIASAANPRLADSAVREIEDAYFPWIGSLHSLLDSLVDHEDDLAAEGRALVGYYASPLDAATRMRAIASEALNRAEALPDGKCHALIVTAMASFYICELHRSSSPHAQLVGPSVLDVFGGLAAPAMAVLNARRVLRRTPRASKEPRRMIAAPPSPEISS